MKNETYMHIHFGKGRATLALLIDEGPDDNFVSVGVAFCSPNDQFVKRVARHKSKGRAISGKRNFFALTLDKKDFVKAAVYEAFLELCMFDTSFAPTWVHKALKNFTFEELKLALRTGGATPSPFEFVGNGGFHMDVQPNAKGGVDVQVRK